MKNVTITMPEKLARWARVKAAEQDKSLSRFVADALETLMNGADSREEFLKTFRSIKPVRLRARGEKRPTREELYDRKLFRR
jgi:hypothetical protein